MAKKKLFVQLWDCPTCGHKGLNALQYKECPDCSQVLSDDFLTNLEYREQIEIDENDPQYIQAMEGPDWLCPVCGKRNPAKFENCSCGTNRSDLESAQGAVDQGDKTQGGIKDWMKDGSQLESQKRKTAAASAQKSAKTKFFLIAGGVVILGLVLFLLFFKQDINVNLLEVGWERSADLQTYTRVTKSDWEMNMPSDARILSRTREIYEYEKVRIGERTEYQTVTKTKKVLDGYENRTRMERRGNGVVEEVTTREPIYRTESYTEEEPRVVPIYEDRPVYKNRYTYTQDLWETKQTLRESGNNQNPKWPGSTISESIQSPRLGDQRIANKREKYTARFADPDKKTYDLTMDFPRWKDLVLGKVYPAAKGLVGGITLK